MRADSWNRCTSEFGDYSLEAFRIFEIIRDTYQTQGKSRAERLTLLRDHAARGETHSVADVTKSLLTKRGLAVTNSADHKKLVQGLVRAEIEAHLRFSERDAGDFTGEPKDKLVRPPTKKLAVPAGETIMGVFGQFEREMPGAVSRDTWNQNRKIVELFADFAGSKEHVSVITRKVVRDWRAQLFHWPSKAVEIKAFRGKGFLAIIESNKSHKKPTISDTTINKYLSALVFLRLSKRKRLYRRRCHGSIP